MGRLGHYPDCPNLPSVSTQRSAFADPIIVYAFHSVHAILFLLCLILSKEESP